MQALFGKIHNVQNQVPFVIFLPRYKPNKVRQCFATSLRARSTNIVASCHSRTNNCEPLIFISGVTIELEQVGQGICSCFVDY